MELINQPHSATIGDKLKEILENNESRRFDIFYMIVAYVQESGVARLKHSIEKFKQSGGQVKAVVGISQKNTSAKGLRLLLPLCDEIYVYHNENPMETFHPKIYAFEKVEQKAIAFVGSSNLTGGGLYTNYEINSFEEYDLTDRIQASKFLEFKAMFNSYATPSDFSKRLDENLIAELLLKNYLKNDSERSSFISILRSRRSGSRDRIFGSKTFHAPRIPRAEIDIWDLKGDLIWKKPRLDASSVQRPISSGTAPTGGLRLTKAGWKVDGNLINQTRYFRMDLFGGFEWLQETASNGEITEVAKVSFAVKILGTDKGIHELKIRHKASWESLQGNYTTLISWGDLSRAIRDANLVGKQLLLYAPPEGETEPFFIEIV
jgi:HKD family nuclease